MFARDAGGTTRDWTQACKRAAAKLSCEDIFETGAVIVPKGGVGPREVEVALGGRVDTCDEYVIEKTRGSTIREETVMTGPHAGSNVVAYDKRRALRQKGTPQRYTQENAPYHLSYLNAKTNRACSSATECNAASLRYEYARTGDGVIVYLVSEAADTEHIDFGGKATLGPGPTDPAACSTWYGTHYGTLVNGDLHGVAKSARLVSVPTNIGCLRPLYYRDVFRALAWILRQRYDGGSPAVVLFIGSLDATKAPPVAVGLLEDLIGALLRTNATVVAPAGSRSRDACDFVPQRMPDVVSVGALDVMAVPELGGRAHPLSRPWRPTNRGPCVSVWSPGGYLEAGSSAGRDATSSNDATAVMSGTAQSASLAAGVAALVLESSPDLNSSDVKRAILDAASTDMLLDPFEDTTAAVLQMPKF